VGGTLAALLLVASWQTQVATEPDWPHETDPAALIQHGSDLRRKGRDEEALLIFKRADELQPSARARAQVALAEQALGRWVPAEADLAYALKSADDDWIKKNRAALETALEVIRGHLGRVVILGSPAGAVVSVNGQAIGKLPMSAPVAVAAGDVLATVDAPGYVSISRKIAVSSGQMARETIDLPLIPPSAPVLAAPAAVPVTAVAATVAAPPEATVSAPVGATRGARGATPALRAGAWVAGGLAAGALIVGTVADVRYVEKVDAFNGPTSGCGTSAPGRGSGTSCQSTYDALTSMKALSIAGFATGAALGIASAVLFWITRGEPATGRLACNTTAQGGGCGLAF
jgi:hypothetical protein